MSWCPEAEAARFEDGLVLRLPEYHGDGWLTALIGTGISGAAVHELLADPAVGGSLHYVPKWLAERFENDPQLSVTPDRDNFDYVRDVDEQIAADDSPFGRIRRNRNRFRRDNPAAETMVSAWRADDLLGVFDAWATMRGRTTEADALDERAGIERLLMRRDLNRCFVVLLTIDGVLSGFAIEEIQPDGTAIGHFQKLTTRALGAWQVVEEAVFTALAERSVKYQNEEQDLGVPGLRQRKQEGQPAFLLEKYLVTLAEDR
jgi:hypothetical protein